jgi:hypothetical protein
MQRSRDAAPETSDDSSIPNAASRGKESAADFTRGIQLLQVWILVASCKLATDQRNTWVIKAKSPTSTICLSNDHDHTQN